MNKCSQFGRSIQFRNRKGNLFHEIVTEAFPNLGKTIDIRSMSRNGFYTATTQKVITKTYYNINNKSYKPKRIFKLARENETPEIAE